MKHPKLGVVRTLVGRAETIVSEDEAKSSEIERVRRSLAVCGYKRWSWNTANKKKEDQQKKDTQRSQCKGSVTLPYIAGVSEKLQRIMRNYGIITHIKPQNTIRSQLVAPKDKTKTIDKAGIVYNIQCTDCPSEYTGESARPLRARLDEHKRSSSPVGAHIAETAHQVDWDKVQVLDREDDWYRRGVREAIHIHRRGSDLNRDRGRHYLPPAYHNLISRDKHSECSRVSKSPTPTTLIRH